MVGNNGQYRVKEIAVLVAFTILNEKLLLRLVRLLGTSNLSS